MERREDERKRKVKVEGRVLIFLLSVHAQTSEKIFSIRERRPPSASLMMIWVVLTRYNGLTSFKGHFQQNFQEQMG